MDLYYILFIIITGSDNNNRTKNFFRGMGNFLF